MILVFALGIVSGFLIPIASGTGLLSLAGLLMLGLPPQTTIATSRMGGVGLWPSVLYKYYKSNLIIWSYVVPLCVIAVVGAIIGANVMLMIPEHILKTCIAILILVLIFPMVLDKRLGVESKDMGSKGRVLGFGGFFFASLYGGAFGSGQGIIGDFSLMKFCGLTLLQSKATAVISRFLMAISSLVVFLIKGIVHLPFGVVLAMGMVIGGWFGAHVAIQKGNLWLKRIFILCMVLMAVKLLYDSFGF